MNELVLIEKNNNRIIYSYRMNGEGDFGEVVYSFVDKQASVSRQSADDKFGVYAYKACRKIEQCATKNSFPEKLIQAWY